MTLILPWYRIYVIEFHEWNKLKIYTLLCDNYAITL